MFESFDDHHTLRADDRPCTPTLPSTPKFDYSPSAVEDPFLPSATSAGYFPLLSHQLDSPSSFSSSPPSASSSSLSSHTIYIPCQSNSARHFPLSASAPAFGDYFHEKQRYQTNTNGISPLGSSFFDVGWERAISSSLEARGMVHAVELSGGDSIRKIRDSHGNLSWESDPSSPSIPRLPPSAQPTLHSSFVSPLPVIPLEPHGSDIPSAFARSGPAVCEHPSPHHPLFSHQGHLLLPTTAPYPLHASPPAGISSFHAFTFAHVGHDASPYYQQYLPLQPHQPQQRVLNHITIPNFSYSCPPIEPFLDVAPARSSSFSSAFSPRLCLMKTIDEHVPTDHHGTLSPDFLTSSENVLPLHPLYPLSPASTMSRSSTNAEADSTVWLSSLAKRRVPESFEELLCDEEVKTLAKRVARSRPGGQGRDSTSKSLRVGADVEGFAGSVNHHPYPHAVSPSNAAPTGAAFERLPTPSPPLAPFTLAPSYSSLPTQIGVYPPSYRPLDNASPAYSTIHATSDQTCFQPPNQPSFRHAAPNPSPQVSQLINPSFIIPTVSYTPSDLRTRPEPALPSPIASSFLSSAAPKPDPPKKRRTTGKDTSWGLAPGMYTLLSVGEKKKARNRFASRALRARKKAEQ